MSLNPRPPQTWTTEELEHWLNVNAQDNLAQIIKKHQIDGLLFLNINQQDIQNGFQITEYFQIKKIQLLVQKLQEENKNFEQQNFNNQQPSVLSYQQQQNHLEIQHQIQEEEQKQIQTVVLPAQPSQIQEPVEEEQKLILSPVNFSCQTQKFEMNHNNLKIGRNLQQNQMVIPEQTISKQHVEIHKKKNKYFIEDLQSSNGTYKKLIGKQKLQFNTTYGIGLNLQFEIQEIKQVGSNKNSQILTILQKSNNQSYNIPFNQQYSAHTIGRNTKNSIVLSNDETLNEFHTKIYKENNDFFIEDLNTFNGTWIRINTKQEYILENNEIYKFGQIQQYKVELIKQSC